MTRIIRNETYIGESMRVTDADRARLAVICCAIFSAVAMFYAATN